MTDATDPTKRPGTTHRIKKARKQQDCAECPDPILKGQPYMFLNTEHHGKWSRYILCRECERIRVCHQIAEHALSAELPYTAGRLRFDAKEYSDSSPAYKREFGRAWVASRLVFRPWTPTESQES